MQYGMSHLEGKQRYTINMDRQRSAFVQDDRGRGRGAALKMRRFRRA
jgi:hypothetical protein